MKRTFKGCLILIVNVDDIIISGNDKDGIQETNDWLNSKQHIKDLGQLQYFLGIEIHRNGQGILLSQRKYVSHVVLNRLFVDQGH